MIKKKGAFHFCPSPNRPVRSSYWSVPVHCSVVWQRAERDVDILLLKFFMQRYFAQKRMKAAFSPLDMGELISDVQYFAVRIKDGRIKW